MYVCMYVCIVGTWTVWTVYGGMYSGMVYIHSQVHHHSTYVHRGMIDSQVCMLHTVLISMYGEFICLYVYIYTYRNRSKEMIGSMY